MGITQPLEILKNERLLFIQKILFQIDDEKNVRSWNEDFYQKWAELNNTGRSTVNDNKRPSLFRSLNVKKTSEILSFVFGKENVYPDFSPGDFQLLLEWFDRILDLQKFDYERCRLLNNGYVVLIYMNLKNTTYPLIYHMIIRTITDFMRYPANVEILSILLLFVFSYVKKNNSGLIRNTGMQLMDLMKDVINIYEENQAIQNYMLDVRKKIQGQIAGLGGSIKCLTEYQLKLDSCLEIKFGLDDIITFLRPDEFKYYMVDHLAAIINFKNTKDCLKSNSKLSRVIITRLLQIIQNDKVPQKSLIKVGYILGKLIPYSQTNASHHPLSATNLGSLEVVIFEGLNDALYSGDRHVREIASQTLACILMEETFLEFAETQLSAATIESIRILMDRLGNMKKIKRPKPKKKYESINLAHVWISEKHQDWISNLSNGILSWKEQLGIFSFLPAILEAHPKMAELLFPFIVFEHLRDLNFKKLFQMQVNKLLSMPTDVHVDIIRSIIRTIDFVRRQSHPDSLSPFENNQRWLTLDFHNLSKSAASSNMGYHALFFAEVALIDNPSKINLYLEILADIYKNIHDADGLIGILMLMNSSQISESLINEKLYNK